MSAEVVFMSKKAKILCRDAIIEHLLILKERLEDKDNRMIIDGTIATLEKIDFDMEE